MVSKPDRDTYNLTPEERERKAKAYHLACWEQMCNPPVPATPEELAERDVARLKEKEERKERMRKEALASMSKYLPFMRPVKFGGDYGSVVSYCKGDEVKAAALIDRQTNKPLPDSDYEAFLERVQALPMNVSIKAEVERLTNAATTAGNDTNEDDPSVIAMAKARYLLRTENRLDVLFKLRRLEELEPTNYSVYLLDDENGDLPAFYLQLIKLETDITYSTFGTEKPIPVISNELLDLLGAYGENVYRRSGKLVRVQGSTIEELTVSNLAETLAYNDIMVRDHGPQIQSIPYAIAVACLNRGRYPGFRELRSLVSHPIFDSTGRIVESGYDPHYKVLVQGGDQGYIMNKDPKEAAAHFMDEVLFAGDDKYLGWPFLGNADRANAFATALSPFLRPCIDNVPMYLCLRRSNEGTGTSWLCEALLSISHGGPTENAPMPGSEEQLDEYLHIRAKAGKEVTWFDNVRRDLKSQTLESYLTGEKRGKRVMGTQESIDIEALPLIVVSGEEAAVIVNRDIRRRSYISVLKAPEEYPSLRTGFKHDPSPMNGKPADPIKAWVLKHRPELVGDLLSMAAAWHRAGSPALYRGPRFGGFEAWSNTIGSILAYAGITGFLENADYVKDLDKESAMLSDLIQYWNKTTGSKPMIGTQLVTMIEETNGNLPLPKNIATAMDTKKPQTALGIILKQLADAGNPIGGLVIKRGISKDHKNVQAYWIEAV